MSASQNAGKQDNAHDAQQDAHTEPQHIEQQPVPGHPERLTDDPDALTPPGGGRLADNAPTATPETKPGTPPGSQSDADRLKTPD